jgi:sugar phosphate isomerase/epimerase
MRAGYHNHAPEWVAVEGKMPMEVIATAVPDVTLQLDIGTCLEKGQDPVAWINRNPGRIRSMHVKEWLPGTGPDKGYRALFAEGETPWAKIFEAAESKGGIEYYLIEQEGSRYSEFETAERCLATWKKMRG